MLEFDRIDVSEGIDGSRECIICHYGYFLRLNFIFQPEVCDGFHDMTKKSISFNDVLVVATGGNDYRNHFWVMSKSEAVDRMKNVDLSEKGGQL